MAFISETISIVSDFISGPGHEITLDNLFNPKKFRLSFQFSCASLTIYSHAYPMLYGAYISERCTRITSGQEPFGGLAIAGFFSLHGFLPQSFFCIANPAQLTSQKRALRLFPVLLVPSFITAFVLSLLLYRSFPFGNFSAHIASLYKDILLNMKA